MRPTLNWNDMGSNPISAEEIVMNTDKTCEYVGVLCKHLAKQGLSWSYSCLAETGHYSHFLRGEGEVIIYYRGFDYPQSNHGRLSFVMEDDGNIFMFGSYGVQGPGEHFHIESITFPTEKQIEDTVNLIADYLKKVRIPIED